MSAASLLSMMRLTFSCASFSENTGTADGAGEELKRPPEEDRIGESLPQVRDER